MCEDVNVLKNPEEYTSIDGHMDYSATKYADALYQYLSETLVVLEKSYTDTCEVVSKTLDGLHVNMIPNVPTLGSMQKRMMCMLGDMYEVHAATYSAIVMMLYISTHNERLKHERKTGTGGADLYKPSKN